MLVEQSAMELERFYINKGYVHADVSTTIDTTRHKKAVVTYHIKANDPYRIRNYTMKFPVLRPYFAGTGIMVLIGII